MIPQTPEIALRWIEKHKDLFENYGDDFSWIPGASLDATELDDVVVALANADIPPFNAYQAGMYMQVQNIFRCWKEYGETSKVIPFSDNLTSNKEVWEGAAKIAQALGLIVYKYIGSMSNMSKYKCPYVAVAHEFDLTQENLKYHRQYVCSITPSRYKEIDFTY